MRLCLWKRFASHGLPDGSSGGRGLLGMMGLVYPWWQRFDESRVCQNYVCMMGLGCLIALGFFLYSVGI
jgi:hypothetical protein